jgi:hypothetical protein
MREPPTDEELRAWHRRFAADANNRAWSLSEKPELTNAERRELLDAAHAAAHHWRKIGTPAQVAQADLLLGRAHALLGNGALARTFATAALDLTTSRNGQPWELALAHAVMADAAAASRDAQLHAQHHEKAKSLGENLAGEDKELFLATFDRIPVPRPKASS